MIIREKTQPDPAEVSRYMKGKRQLDSDLHLEDLSLYWQVEALFRLFLVQRTITGMKLIISLWLSC